MTQRSCDDTLCVMTLPDDLLRILTTTKSKRDSDKKSLLNFK